MFIECFECELNLNLLFNSFMGGTNFWGGSKEDDIFLAPSVDDKILEVVAVFGSMQMAASRLINLQHHRIAQCQTVQINILGKYRHSQYNPFTTVVNHLTVTVDVTL